MSFLIHFQRYLCSANPAGAAFVAEKLKSRFEDSPSQSQLTDYFRAIEAVYPAGFISLGNPAGFRMFSSGGAELVQSQKQDLWAKHGRLQCFAQIDQVGHLVLPSEELDSTVFLVGMTGNKPLIVAGSMSDFFKGMAAVACSKVLSGKPSAGALSKASEVYLGAVTGLVTSPWSLKA